MYRYRAIASFHLWNEVCETAMNATRALLVERGIAAKIANFESSGTISSFVKLSHASGRDNVAILSLGTAGLHSDVRRGLRRAIWKIRRSTAARTPGNSSSG